MKYYFKAAIIFLFFFSLVAIMHSCIKEKPLTVTTLPVSQISYHSATSGVERSGGGIIFQCGVCFSTHPNPTYYDSQGETDNYSTFYLKDLKPNTIYHVRAYVGEGNSVTYGSEIEFKTLTLEPVMFNLGLTYGSLVDIDGNTYRTINIGSQVWMAENLRATKYQDGFNIPKIEDINTWDTDSIGAYCFYQNDNTFSSTFGCLYNFYAIANEHNLCPVGWHVSTKSEWTTLVNYLGGESLAGGKLKEIGTIHWDIPNTGANNESGFSALPGGCCYYVDGFHRLGEYGVWWNYSENTPDHLSMSYKGSSLSQWVALKRMGYSVRCVKNN